MKLCVFDFLNETLKYLLEVSRQASKIFSLNISLYFQLFK